MFARGFYYVSTTISKYNDHAMSNTPVAPSARRIQYASRSPPGHVWRVFIAWVFVRQLVQWVCQCGGLLMQIASVQLKYAAW